MLGSRRSCQSPKCLRTVSGNSREPLDRFFSFLFFANWDRNTNLTWLGNPGHLPDVPVLPWNHSQRFWHESHLGIAHRNRSNGRKDLVGVRAIHSTEHRSTWNHFLRLRENPWIKDHQVQRGILYPAAGMITMAVEGFRELVPNRENLSGFYITSFTIDRPMVVPESDHGLEVSMVLTNLHGSNFEHDFDIHSRHFNGQWQKNASGKIKIRTSSEVSPLEFAQYKTRWNSLTDKPKSAMDPSQLYASVEDHGLNYGPMFRNIKSAKVIAGGDDDLPACIGTVRVPDTKSKMPHKFEYPHLIHPVTLDSMMQTLFAVYSDSMIPTSCEKIWISADLVGEAGAEFEGYSEGMMEGTGGALGTIVMTAEGREIPSVVMDGARFTKMARPPVEKGGHIAHRRNLASEIVWNEEVSLAKLNTFEELLSLLSHKYPGLSIFQFGLDSTAAEGILNVLHPQSKQRCHFSRYTVSDNDGGVKILENIKNVFEDRPVLGCIEARKYHPDSSEEFPSYNLIIANCDSESVFIDLGQRLLPGGFLLRVVHGSNKHRLAEKPHIIHCPLLGLNFQLHRRNIERENMSNSEVIFLIPGNSSPRLQSMTSSLSKEFQKQGIKPITMGLDALIQLASEDTERQENSFEIDGKPCVSFLSVQEDDDFLFNLSSQGFAAFKYLTKKTKSILWLTTNVYMSPSNPQSSLIIGLSRTLMSEDPAKKFATFDVSRKKELSSWASLCLEVFARTFFAKQALGPQDFEYATDGERLLTPRLQPLNILNGVIEGTGSHEVQVMRFGEDARLGFFLGERAINNYSQCWGILDHYKDDLGPREVEIQFVSAPLLEEDYETTLGQTTLTSLGLDICGRVKKAGDNVHDLKEGDLVVGISLDGGFQNMVRLDRGMVAKVPGNDVRLGSKLFLSCYLSAWYAVDAVTHHHDLQRKTFGQKRCSILVHNATSAYGQAAVILAQALGLGVYATSSHEDIETLQELGIQGNHIIPLAALSFWNGKVDIVYDPKGSLFLQSAHHAEHCKLSPFPFHIPCLAVIESLYTKLLTYQAMRR